MAVVRTRPIQRAKAMIREVLNTLLLTIPDEEKNIQSLIIQKMLFELPVFITSTRISCYINNHLMVQTDGIIRQVINDKKSLFVPRFHVEQKFMQMLLVKTIEDYETLPASNYRGGIRQPKVSDLREEAMATGGLDLMIVPGLAFTDKGKRLGAGSGFYDSYIRKFKNDSLRPTLIGVAFRQQVFPYLPVHMHDVPVDIVLRPP